MDELDVTVDLFSDVRRSISIHGISKRGRGGLIAG
jgi:hypothetical protein